MTSIPIGLVAWLSTAVLLWVLLFMSGRRRGEPHQTAGQVFVVVLYWIARWWQCVAVGMDAGVLAYHRHREGTKIAPECTAQKTAIGE
jgi:hypothetical protein